jgi:polysaccharide biosynthesis transport protein
MEQESTPRLSDYAVTFKRRAGLAAAIGLPVAVIGIVFALALPDVYRSTAVFQLREGTDPQAVRRDQDYADQYVSALTSDVMQAPNRRALVQEVQPYPALKDDPAEATMKVMEAVSVNMVTEKILDPSSGRERDINAGFTVSYEHRDPEMAAKAASWIADKFIIISRRDASQRMADQGKFYAAEAERTRARISELEAKLAEFKRTNFDSLPDSAQSNMSVRSQAEQEIASIQREMNTLQQSRAFMSNQLSQLNAGNVGGQTAYQLEDEYRRKRASYDENHPDMVALRRQIEGLKLGASSTAGMSLPAQLKMKRSILEETRQRYSDNHPDVKRLTRDIATLEQRIARGEKAPVEDTEANTPASIQLRTQLNAIDSQLASLQLRNAELRNRVKDIDVRLASTPGVEREYESLTRDIGSARQQYDQLLGRRMDAELQAAGIVAGNADKFRMIERPRIADEPAKPYRTAIALLGVIAALALAFIAILVAEVLDGTVRSSRDIQSLLHTTPLAVIPEIRSPDYRPWRTREARVFATSLVAGIPIVYLLARLLTQ